ncbi:hypothetical protein MNBD_PLANCTO03-1652, partial [hydrothermal vent metagenome]
ETYEEYQYPRDEKTKNSDLEEARADLDRIRTQNKINADAKQSALDTTTRQRDLKKERLDKLTEQVDLATIIAPTDGLVVYATSLGRGRDMMMMGGDGPLQVGREVRPNEMLIVLPDTTSMVASVRVHESLAGRVRPGQPVGITIDAMNSESFVGTVESVSVLPETGGWRDPNRREYIVRIAVDHDNADGKLKPSMRAEAEIMLGSVQDSLMVPIQAIFHEGPVRYVLVPQSSRYVRVPVKVGRMSDTYAQILAGIEEGDRVLLREPETGEQLADEWTPEQLEAVGIALDEEGKPIVTRRGADMMRMMRTPSATDSPPKGSKRGPNSSAKPEKTTAQETHTTQASDNAPTPEPPSSEAPLTSDETTAASKAEPQAEHAPATDTPAEGTE